jgi:hypothetical protein
MTELRTLSFGIIDIQEVRQDLTDDQAMDVLMHLKTWEDYPNGLTDEFIRTTANDFYTESKP